MIANGWNLLFHQCLLDQLEHLKQASDRALKADPRGAPANANVKLYAALAQLMLRTVPDDPSRDEFRQGLTLGPAYRHWRRAKIGRRFRLFFRYDSVSRVIVYAWVNDESSLRSAGGKNDPYAVFQKMLAKGTPPDSFGALVKSAGKSMP